MDVLVHASVWVDHFRNGNAGLVDLMARDAVLIHPFVLTELACGTLPAPRQRTLADLARLRWAQQASQAEVLAFTEREKLYGLGCGLAGMSLLASTRITPGACLWTLDKPLAALAVRLGVGWH